MWKVAFLLLLLPDVLRADLDSDLFMEVTVSKKEIVQFEPVVLTITTRNLLRVPRKIPRSFDPNGDHLNIHFIDADGKKTSWGTHGTSDAVVGQLELEPANKFGGLFRHRLVLHPYPGSFLDKPGKFQVYVTFTVAGDATGSTPATVTVKPAEGVNQKALERFRGWPQAKFMGGVSTCPEIADEFEAVIREYPESVYVPWCYYALGVAHQKQNRGDAKSNALNARRNYQSLLEKFPKFPLKAEVEYEMARELFRLDKSDAARYELEKVTEFSQLNREARLVLFHKARQVLDRFEDGNTEPRYLDFPSHR